MKLRELLGLAYEQSMHAGFEILTAYPAVDTDLEMIHDPAAVATLKKAIGRHRDAINLLTAALPDKMELDSHRS